MTRWRSVSEPRVFVSGNATERSIVEERRGPQPGWQRSTVPTVIVWVSLEQRKITSAAAISPERRRRFSSARVARIRLARSSASSRCGSGRGSAVRSKEGCRVVHGDFSGPPAEPLRDERSYAGGDPASSRSSHGHALSAVFAVRPSADHEPSRLPAQVNGDR